MPALTVDQIKNIVVRFVPHSLQENILVRSLLAGAAAIAVLVATPAFAPVGVVGATGWIIVYAVTGGTLTFELVRAAWDRWKHMTPEQRADVDAKLAVLKTARDNGAITDEDYKARAAAILDAAMGNVRPAGPQDVP